MEVRLARLVARRSIGTGIAMDKMLALTGQTPVGIQIANIQMPTPEERAERCAIARQAGRNCERRLVKRSSALSRKGNLRASAVSFLSLYLISLAVADRRVIPIPA